MRRAPTLLFLVILIEGYVVLASELLAIRQLLPFVGSGTEVIAIIISAVLLPLAIGYHRGGRKRRRIRARLIRNMLAALFFLSIALSYPLLEVFFTALDGVGLRQPVPQAALYCAAFLIWPIYLLGQTVPLISNYFAKARVSELTGRMLFFSTVGSFLGSVFSTLVLMNIIGVHLTVLVTLTLLALLIPLLSRVALNAASAAAVLVLLFAVTCNSPMMMRALGIVSNNAYNMIVVKKDEASGARFFHVNRSSSSALGGHDERIYAYIAYTESIFIDPIKASGHEPREMLILGAGGFTIGLDDKVNNYTFVDIDPDLKDVAEQNFLHAMLSPNKHFVPASARAFVRRAPAQQYDFIFIDTYTNILSVPMETTSREFLIDVKRLLKPTGALVVNQVAQPDMRDRFGLRYDNTFASVFKNHTRQVMDRYDPWTDDDGAARLRNILYIYYARADETDDTVYTDDLNTYALDRYGD